MLGRGAARNPQAFQFCVPSFHVKNFTTKMSPMLFLQGAISGKTAKE
jgi:hypothetical protein